MLDLEGRTEVDFNDLSPQAQLAFKLMLVQFGTFVQAWGPENSTSIILSALDLVLDQYEEMEAIEAGDITVN